MSVKTLELKYTATEDENLCGSSHFTLYSRYPVSDCSKFSTTAVETLSEERFRVIIGLLQSPVNTIAREFGTLPMRYSSSSSIVYVIEVSQ